MTPLELLPDSITQKRSHFIQHAWALFDQFTVSAGNFLTQLILARLLAPSQYGIYAVLISTVLFLNALHAGVVILTIYIRCASASPKVAQSATSAALVVTLSCGLILAVPLIVASVILKRPDLTLCVSFAMIAWQAQETVRAALLSRLQHRGAVFGDAMSYLGQSFFLALLARFSLLTLQLTFITIGVTSLLAMAIQLSTVGYARPRKEAVAEFCRYSFQTGRLALPAKLVSFFTIQSFPWALELSAGSASAGVFQALTNVLGGANSILIGTGSLVTACMANARTLSGLKRARGHALFGVLAVAPWLLFVASSPETALRLFYGDASPYLTATLPLRIMVAASFLEAIALPITCIMTGLNKIHFMLVMQSIGAVTFLFCGYLILRLAVPGAAITLVVVQLSRSIYGLKYYLKTASELSRAPATTLGAVVNA